MRWPTSCLLLWARKPRAIWPALGASWVASAISGRCTALLADGFHAAVKFEIGRLVGIRPLVRPMPFSGPISRVL